MEKKKAQQEKKFLEVAQKQLNLEVAASAKDVRDSTKAADDVYHKFLNDYAACEDRIHKKWVQLQKEQENLMKMVEARYKKDQDVIKDASALHITGLSKTRTACKEYQAVIDRLIFRAQEEDNEA
ncbi:hypothetical protein M413DRAFT_11219 [Hebeloma cylindrosporum]|uniref:Uncharacterized protein n=1 Tax=Hebeloma cylindrosporum TaxID=76867 RepID=A0A0C3C9P2_HEBCY|nr:hypothetical protein M413DRAFT_11219 [Hebeloma cylindrosporum h7]